MYLRIVPARCYVDSRASSIEGSIFFLHGFWCPMCVSIVYGQTDQSLNQGWATPGRVACNLPYHHSKGACIHISSDRACCTCTLGALGGGAESESIKLAILY